MYKYINSIIFNFLSFIKTNLLIHSSHLNYNNIGFFNINKINNEDLKSLYLLYIANNNLYINNYYLSHNKLLIQNEKDSIYFKKIYRR